MDENPSPTGCSSVERVRGVVGRLEVEWAASGKSRSVTVGRGGAVGELEPELEVPRWSGQV